MCDTGASGSGRRDRSEKALALLNSGAFAEAEPLLKAVVEDMKAVKDDQGRETAASLVWTRRLMWSLTAQGKFLEGERLAQRALHNFEARWGQSDEDLLDIKLLLAECLLEQRKERDAAPYACEALEGLEENLRRGPDHHTTIQCKALYAVILGKVGRLEEAKSMAQAAHEAFEAAREKSEIRLAQGGRRPSEPEQHGIQKASRILGEVAVRRRSFSKAETVSTAAPSEDDELSLPPMSRHTTIS